MDEFNRRLARADGLKAEPDPDLARRGRDGDSLLVPARRWAGARAHRSHIGDQACAPYHESARL